MAWKQPESAVAQGSPKKHHRGSDPLSPAAAEVRRPSCCCCCCCRRLPAEDRSHFLPSALDDTRETGRPPKEHGRPASRRTRTRSKNGPTSPKRRFPTDRRPRSYRNVALDGVARRRLLSIERRPSVRPTTGDTLSQSAS